MCRHVNYDNRECGGKNIDNDWNISTYDSQTSESFSSVDSAETISNALIESWVHLNNTQGYIRNIIGKFDCHNANSYQQQSIIRLEYLKKTLIVKD